jgi:hypothetical protein
MKLSNRILKKEFCSFRTLKEQTKIQTFICNIQFCNILIIQNIHSVTFVVYNKAVVNIIIHITCKFSKQNVWILIAMCWINIPL